jgi:hypothetical protein
MPECACSLLHHHHVADHDEFVTACRGCAVRAVIDKQDPNVGTLAELLRPCCESSAHMPLAGVWYAATCCTAVCAGRQRCCCFCMDACMYPHTDVAQQLDSALEVIKRVSINKLIWFLLLVVTHSVLQCSWHSASLLDATQPFGRVTKWFLMSRLLSASRGVAHLQRCMMLP